MQLWKTLAAATLVPLFALAPLAANADTLDKVMQAKKLRVAIDLGVPPFGMKDDKLQPTGSDVETAKLLAAAWGVTLEIVPTTSPNRIPFLQTDKADIVISSVAITPERAKVIDFSIPYAVTYAVVAAPKSVQIKSAADLAGKRIIATRGTTNDNELTKIVPAGANVTRFDDDATSITAITSGQAQIFATAPALLIPINQRLPDDRKLEAKFVMKAYALGIGVRKGDAKLKAKIDEFVKTNVENGKLEAIYSQFHGMKLPADLMQMN